VETVNISRYLAWMEDYSPELAQHCLNTAGISFMIAESLDLSEKEITRIVVGAMLHDLGFLKIQRDTLHRPGPLTEREWREVRRHPLMGLEIISQEKQLDPIQSMLLYHHERWDGRGYFGLAGEKIPWEARILTLADALEAMSSPRPYRPALSPRQLEEEILRNSGSQFDPDLVQKVLFQDHHFSPLTCICIGNLKTVISREKKRLLELVDKYHSLNHPLVWAQSRRLDKLVVFSYRNSPWENPWN
jgi:HD-GYP domain-containing protein (c-di-GMP phosphodiesterase class II)